MDQQQLWVRTDLFYRVHDSNNDKCEALHEINRRNGTFTSISSQWPQEGWTELIVSGDIGNRNRTVLEINALIGMYAYYGLPAASEPEMNSPEATSKPESVKTSTTKKPSAGKKADSEKQVTASNSRFENKPLEVEQQAKPESVVKKSTTKKPNTGNKADSEKEVTASNSRFENKPLEVEQQAKPESVVKKSTTKKPNTGNMADSEKSARASNSGAGNKPSAVEKQAKPESVKKLTNKKPSASMKKDSEKAATACNSGVGNKPLALEQQAMSAYKRQIIGAEYHGAHRCLYCRVMTPKLQMHWPECKADAFGSCGNCIYHGRICSFVQDHAVQVAAEPEATAVPQAAREATGPGNDAFVTADMVARLEARVQKLERVQEDVRNLEGIVRELLLAQPAKDDNKQAEEWREGKGKKRARAD